jgi:hypothetical protein
MVNEETLAQIPEDVRLYLRALRRRILELEQTDPQQRIAELEAANRCLQGELDEVLAVVAQVDVHSVRRVERPETSSARPADRTKCKDGKAEMGKSATNHWAEAAPDPTPTSPRGGG